MLLGTLPGRSRTLLELVQGSFSSRLAAILIRDFECNGENEWRLLVETRRDILASSHLLDTGQIDGKFIMARSCVPKLIRSTRKTKNGDS